MNDTEILDFDKFNWEDYFERGKELLKKDLESDAKMWDRWTKSEKRYVLICYIMIMNNNIDITCGRVTADLDCHISSDNIEDLILFWESKFIKERYDSTRQHFIIDTKEKKVVKFCSVCM